MTQIKKHIIAEIGIGSSINFAMRNSFEHNNIDYEVETRIDSFEGSPEHIVIFMVSSDQIEKANRLMEIVIRENPIHPTYQKFKWIGIWILSIAILSILTAFLLNIYGVL